MASSIPDLQSSVSRLPSKSCANDRCWKSPGGDMTTLARRRYFRSGRAPLHISAVSQQLLEYFGAKVTLVRTNFLNLVLCFSAILSRPEVRRVQLTSSRLVNSGKKQSSSGLLGSANRWSISRYPPPNRTPRRRVLSCLRHRRLWRQFS